MNTFWGKEHKRNEKSFRKTLVYIGYTIRGCFRAYPAFFAQTIILDAAALVIAVGGPLLLAHILELASGEHGVNAEGLVGSILLYGLFLVWEPIRVAVNDRCVVMAQVRGEKYFGNKLFHFAKKIQLEALENPEILDKFKRAETSVEELQHFLVLAMGLGMIESIGACVGTMVVVGRYSPVLVIMGLLGVIPTMLIAMSNEKIWTRLRRRQSSLMRRESYLWKLMSQRDAVKEMRVMGFDDYLMDRWEEANVQRAEEIRQYNLKTTIKSNVGLCVENFFYAANIGMTLYLMVKGQIAISAFAACLSAFANFQGNMRGLAYKTPRTLLSGWHMVEDYYDYFSVPTEEERTVEYSPFESSIGAKNVHFRYNGSDREALRGVDLEIRRGEHVVIVGENGSGKTTLSKLLTGLYLPCEGSVCYDRQSTDTLRRGSLYDHISVVSQDFVHYQFTLRENIGISDLKHMEDTAQMEALTESVAGAEFLKKTGGLDVQVGREFGGIELSGGEWQKVAIARGLWKDSDIIILDEPTSALDPLVEYDILSKFVDMIQDKTSVIISHRVGICRTADKIIVMKDGRAVECGSHEELLGANGEYARIWNEQAKWYV